MANFKHVNQYIKANFPSLDIQATRGKGYVYFEGEHGFDIIPSLFTHPVSTSTDDMVRMVLESIADIYPEA